MISFLRRAIPGMLLLSSSSALFAQHTMFENHELEPVQVNMKITNIDGKKVLRMFRDTATQGSDIPTFVRLNNTENFSNGTIEVMLQSRLLPTADATARGFIGLAFRINKDKSRFECIYSGLPTEGRMIRFAGITPLNTFPIPIINMTGCEKKRKENMSLMPTWD